MHNFRKDTNKFISNLSKCLTDDKCNVFYRHIGKTGGTTVEARMFQGFPFTYASKHQESCCGIDVMNDFKNNKEKYCNAKFTSYQISSFFLENVVKDCMDLKPDDHRALVLVSMRDPASRTISNIHQICNKKLTKRDDKVLRACRDCKYEGEHIEVFNRFVDLTNEAYLDIIDVTQLPYAIPNVNVMTFDTDDINELFSLLQDEMPNHSFLEAEEKKNPESIWNCDFALNSKMLKRLKISREIYRNLTAGIIN